MRIRAGCELSFEFSQTMPMIVTLTVHFSRFSDLERPDHLMTNPSVPIEGYRDSFGNWCSRLVAPEGRFSLGTDAIVRDAGGPDPADLNALQHIDDQERGSAQLHGQGALWHLGGTGQERRSGLDARQAVLTRLWEASATETYTAATL